MTKEDKQIVDRAVKEYWRLGDRSHLKRLLKKNLKLYRENVELEERLTFARAEVQRQYKENEELKSELKEWKDEWHDLRKDKNDLPENKRNVWCDYDDGYGKGFYNKDEGGWWIEGHMFCSAIDAWCELPTFDKE